MQIRIFTDVNPGPDIRFCKTGSWLFFELLNTQFFVFLIFSILMVGSGSVYMYCTVCCRSGESLNNIILLKKEDDGLISEDSIRGSVGSNPPICRVY